ncbi:type VI secretion system baseplate subunit TssF [Silvibacterium sp.]|uniref:type VI secretion system baseplate subunit TssF n=1 Tax=Silvibacterium sp. TaxID=1964179 RepID=UPI0039E6A21A
MRTEEDFLRYYFDELSYLRDAGRDFAREHPKVAARLDMPHGETADPHVERLIESFAFLTARLQRKMHAEFPTITTALLGSLYPQLVQPLPPMAIAQFDVGATIKGLTEGFRIPRGTRLFAQEKSGLTCRFQTCYQSTLWPVTVVEAAFEQAVHHRLPANGPVLRIRLHAREDLLRNPDFLPSLRFFLDGPPELTGTLYEILFANATDIYLADSSDPRPVSIGLSALQSVGFDPEHEVLPYPSHALPGYRLLQEYFSFPQKFLFFEVDRLAMRRCASATAAPSGFLDLIFVLKELPQPEPAIGARNFRLGCTPIRNLFSKTTEPIRLNHLQLEYRLISDVRREASTEIHSIERVSGSPNPAERSRSYEPFFSFRNGVSRDAAQPSSAFWMARRVRSDRADLPGTDIYLSFLDPAFNPAQPADETVFAHALCTNRWLASELPDHAELNIEETTPVLRIACLTKPTLPVYPPLEGASLWRLVSSLTLHSSTLMEGEGGLHALREILRLYSFTGHTSAQQEIDGISRMQASRILRRVGPQAWRGFRRGIEVDFSFDPMQYKAGSALLLASVLRHFLRLYGSVNTFTQLVARRSSVEGEWKRWAPLEGAREAL